MAIDPTILQRIGIQSNTPVLQNFQNALISQKNLEAKQQAMDIQAAEAPIRERLLEAQTGTAEAGLTKQQQENRIRSLAVFGNQINSDVKSGNLQGVRDQVINRLSNLGDQGLPTAETQRILNLIDNPQINSADKLAQLDQLVKTGNQIAVQAGVLDSLPVTGGLADEVKSSKILDSGVTQIVRKSGKVEVIEPTQAEAEMIRKAEERGVDIQQRRAQGRVLGKDSAKIANKAFEQTDKIRNNNISLRKVIAEVRGGAETGPLISKMPSFRAASVRLETLKNQLGLDVVGSVTFGALSEGELNLALNTALPTNLDGPELIQWAEDKISAQEKLSGYLEDQAIFLSKPGNTLADWLIKVKGEDAASPVIEDEKPTDQPVIRFDRQGNRIP